jgi:short-subunit dehydrogenase
VAPAAVETEYWHKNQTRKPVTPAWIPLLNCEEVARASVNAALGRKSILVLPRECDFCAFSTILFLDGSIA